MSSPPAVAQDTRILHGTPIAAAIRSEVLADIDAFEGRHGFRPGIVVVRVGEDAASRVYAARILKSAAAVGCMGEQLELPAAITPAGLRDELDGLDRRPEVTGIILQLPLPAHIPLRDVVVALDPRKDIDGIHPFNAGLLATGHDGHRPSCAEAAVEILRRSGVALAGRRAVVVGRSNVVGKPAQLLLMRENATVTVCHRQTRDLAAAVRDAEVVLVAAGVPGLITGDMIAAGATVVDCGINVVPGGIVGDVDVATVMGRAAAITPVPGGVGPVTNAVLLRHLARAARALAEGDYPMMAR